MRRTCTISSWRTWLASLKRSKIHPRAPIQIQSVVVWRRTPVLPLNWELRGPVQAQEVSKWCHLKWRQFSSGVNAEQEIMVSRLRISHLHGRTEWPSARLSITFSLNLSTFKRLIQITGDRTTNLHSRPENVMPVFRISWLLMTWRPWLPTAGWTLKWFSRTFRRCTECAMKCRWQHCLFWQSSNHHSCPPMLRKDTQDQICEHWCN